MGRFSLDELKRKAQAALSDAVEKASELGQQATNYGREKTLEVVETIATVIDEQAPKVKTSIMDTVEIAKSNINNYIKLIQRDNMAAHKVIMLGGRRAGKSTILASILHALNNGKATSLCTINDITDYTQVITDERGNTYPLPTLKEKRLEVKRYIDDRHEHTSFLVDMSPTYGKASYEFKVNADQTSINLEFVDVPGEWMRKNVKEFNQLKEQVMTSDVFVIAIDTPFLMQDDDDINNVYNRIEEITDVIAEIKIDPKVEEDRRLIILAPIKCERWIQSGCADLVNQKVKHAYRNLINTWIKFPNIDIWIMPIQTVGGLESAKLLPALRFWDKGERHGFGESCSQDEMSGLLITRDGTTIDPDTVGDIEPDNQWEIDHTTIPLSWYRKNELGFGPIDCEQPGYHILRFLVNKEEQVIIERAKREKEELDESNPFWRFFKQFFNPTFGKYLPVWKDMIYEMGQRGLIKEQGDGFERITSVVE